MDLDLLATDVKNNQHATRMEGGNGMDQTGIKTKKNFTWILFTGWNICDIWNSPLLRYPSMMNQVLAQLFGDCMLTDDIMLIMIDHLRDQLQESPELAKSTVIVNSSFYKMFFL